MRRHWQLATWLLACAAAAAVAAPPAAPLTVVCHGAARAAVYVAPASAVGAGEIGGGEIGMAAFWPRYYRGTTPTTFALPPGEYLVSVMPSAEYDLHGAMQRAREVVWDGYDHHAVVYQARTSRWRYAHCYRVTKEANEPLTVFAAFAPMPEAGECAVLTPTGGGGTKFTAGDEEGLKQLEAGGVSAALHDTVLQAVTAGNKVLIQGGETRWIVSVSAPNRLLIQQGRGTTAWSGHRLTVLSGE